MANKATSSKVGEVRSAKRCWNCRDRKIACDRALPGCDKCRQRGKTCEGYGLRLSWPKDNDARRSARGDGHYIQRQMTAAYEFVDASMHDIDLFQGSSSSNGNDKNNATPIHLDRAMALSPSSPSSLPGSQRSYISPASLMASQPYIMPAAQEVTSMAYLDPSLTVEGHSLLPGVFSGASDQFDDLYGLLVRMSLTDDGAPALATRHALSALSYQTLGQQAIAYAHQSTAIRALQVAIENPALQPAQYFQAMAASMLLNYYEILDEHGSAASSAIYFCGCKRLALAMHREHRNYQGDLALILDWVFYHDAMYKFSIHHWEKRTAAQVMVKDGPKILSKPIFSPLRHVVNPSLGCSLELLEILCQVVDTVLEPANPSYHSPEHLRALRQAELRLDGVVQHVSTVSGVDGLDSSGGSVASNDIHDNSNNNNSHSLPFLNEPPQYQQTESQLYAVATKLYLLRLGRGLDKQSDAVQDLLDTGFALLKTLRRCRRPWLLFVLGVEARDDDERRLVLCSMAPDEPQLRQPKNIRLVRRLIQAAWTQQDLHATEPGTASSSSSTKDTGCLLRIYNTVISANSAPPIFA
ncbi:hypothetical protein SCUCBS95973_007138 [Sporothrix curviconia]|uniref:Zn(2)-C6 fungal-type domain-containing protein n=1 Tax=Sporothrix curviconia TaxID=1260050 RepID=A0ABP0CAU2_9PEZI